MTEEAQNLKAIYHRRFSQTAAYRNRACRELTASFIGSWIRSDGTALELGCGYGEFSNNIRADRKLAMNLNLNEAFRRTLALCGTLPNIVSSTGRYAMENLPALPASGGTCRAVTPVPGFHPGSRVPCPLDKGSGAKGKGLLILLTPFRIGVLRELAE